MLGLDNAGKTTITRNILNCDTSEVSPTIGFEIHTLAYKDHNLNIWDIGGQSSIRDFWGNYFDKTDVVVWVIDIASSERLQHSYRELHQKVMEQDRLAGMHLLVLINKTELVLADQSATVKKETIQKLGLENHKHYKGKWAVMTVSGITGDGLQDALEWIITREYPV